MSRQETQIDDLEEAFRVEKVSHGRYVGAHPLRLPVKYARGVYGGNTIAQTLLVALQYQKDLGWTQAVPESFHNHFIMAGDSRVPMEYEVVSYGDPVAKVSVIARQKGRVRTTATAIIRREAIRNRQVEEAMNKQAIEEKGLDSSFVDTPKSWWFHKYHENAPHGLQQVHHTGCIRNAYPREYIEYEKQVEELRNEPSERWMTIWGGINNVVRPEYRKEDVLQPLPIEPWMAEIYETKPGLPGIGRTMEIVPSEYQSSFSDNSFNYVGLACLTDSAFLTTLPRILHVPFNPSKDHPYLPYDEFKDARALMTQSLNIIHLFHYNAMSLDHHIYFNDGMDGLDIVKEWVCFSYQFKRVSNNRSLVRGFIYNKKGRLAATVVQEGLTYFLPGVPDVVPKE